MTGGRGLQVVFLGLWFLSSAAWSECDFTQFPLMDDMSITDMGGQSVWNNRPMMIKGFTSEASLSRVKAFYHRVWEDRYDDSVFTIWQQITTITDDCMMTVQVAEQDFGGGSFGRLIISNPSRVSAGTPIGAGVFRPMNARVVTDMESKDGYKNGRVSLLTSTDTVDEVVEFDAKEMPRKGWALERAFQEGGGRVLIFRKEVSEFNVLVMEASEVTQILINQVDIR